MRYTVKAIFESNSTGKWIFGKIVIRSTYGSGLFVRYSDFSFTQVKIQREFLEYLSRNV